MLSLASTTGTFLAKTTGRILLLFFHCRGVARSGAAVAVLVAVVIQEMVPKSKSFQGSLDQWLPFSTRKKVGTKKQSIHSKRISLRYITNSISHVEGNRLFWLVGLSHSLSFLARSRRYFFHEDFLLPVKFQPL